MASRHCRLCGKYSENSTDLRGPYWVMDVRDVPYVCYPCKRFWDIWWELPVSPPIAFATYEESYALNAEECDSGKSKICASCGIGFTSGLSNCFCPKCRKQYVERNRPSRFFEKLKCGLCEKNNVPFNKNQPYCRHCTKQFGFHC